MTRDNLLAQMGLVIPDAAKLRMIVDTDAKNEADDQFAIIHHLLTPTLEIRGIIATHFEVKAHMSGDSMERSYEECCRVLERSNITDIPVYRGCVYPLKDVQDAPDSDGVRFIIEEARKEDDRPLYIAIQGAATNVAAAINQAPDIASKLIIVWNGGSDYNAPFFFKEFNLQQDPEACRVILASEAQVWQIPNNVYSTLEVTLAELARNVRPCGKIGRYLFAQLVEQNRKDYNPNFLLRPGESWVLGDNATVAVFLSKFRGTWHTRKAPIITEDLRYAENPDGKIIRVYDSIDVRLTIEDFFAKLQLAYR